MASPRKNGNTAALLQPMIEEISAGGGESEVIHLYDQEVLPCLACRKCQEDWTIFGCVHKDDGQKIFDKAILDRLVYGMNKYYGDQKGPSLWAGKSLALVTTCGYRPEKGADLWEEGMKRYCKHSQLHYRGMLCERHLGYDTVFMDAEKEAHARAFAQELLGLWG